jgi:hypothetical protein
MVRTEPRYLAEDTGEVVPWVERSITRRMYGDSRNAFRRITLAVMRPYTREIRTAASRRLILRGAGGWKIARVGRHGRE